MSGTDSMSDDGSPVAPATTAPGPEGVPMVAVGPGDVVGRYRVVGLLGTGGMGQVFTAIDPELGRTVALKLIRPGRGRFSGARTRMLREAQALAKLQHPNVVAVHDVGVQDEQVFIAMELVAGRTLGEWLRAGPRDWPAIRDVFLAAGRGLAAAHAAGIVHRDFTPANVIVGADRVVVVDFGLAFSDDSADGARESGPGLPTVLDVNVTLTGERIGTLRYMAPEQHTGDTITVLADQFSFANALWLAAYGELPYRGDTSAAVMASMKEPLPPTPKGKVPDHVRPALARALSLRPADRWPRLTDLFDELARDPGAKRRRRLAALAAGAAVAAVAAPLAFFAGRHTPTPADPCDGGDRLAASVWTDGARARAEAAFLGSGLPSARASFGRIDAAMRDNLAAWSAAHRDTCEATRVRHEQSEALLDLRMACLGNARRELGAFAEALGRDLDRGRIDRAVSASARSLDLALCSNAAELQAAVPPPRDPEAAQVVAELSAEIDRLEAENKLDRAVVVLPQARALLPRVRAAGHPPLLARLLFRLGVLEANSGDSDVGIDHLYEADRAAGEAHDDYTHARILANLIRIISVNRARLDEAAHLIPLAEGAALRVGHDPELLTPLYHDEGVFFYKARHDAVAGLGRLGLALAMAQSLRTGRQGSDIGLILNSIASAEELVGGVERSLPTYRRAAKVLEESLGPEHPRTLLVLGNIAAGVLLLGDYQEAEPLIERDLEQSERNWGAESEDVAIAATNLALVRLYLGRIDDAHELADRSLRIFSRALGAENPAILEGVDISARVALEEARFEDAIAGERRAVATTEAALGKKNEALIMPLLVLSEAELAAGHLGEARAAATRGVAIAAEVQSARLAEALLREGDVLTRSRRSADAIADYEKALARAEAAHGPAHPMVLEVLRSSVDALIASGRVADAVAAAERAYGLAANRGPWFLARTEIALARALAAEGKDRPRALSLARSARARLDGTAYRRTLREIDAFLAGAAP